MNIKYLTLLSLLFPLSLAAHIEPIDEELKCKALVEEKMAFIFKLDHESEKHQKVAAKLEDIDRLIDEKSYCDADELIVKVFRE